MFFDKVAKIIAMISLLLFIFQQIGFSADILIFLNPQK